MLSLLIKVTLNSSVVPSFRDAEEWCLVRMNKARSCDIINEIKQDLPLNNP